MFVEYLGTVSLLLGIVTGMWGLYQIITSLKGGKLKYSGIIFASVAVVLLLAPLALNQSSAQGTALTQSAPGASQTQPNRSVTTPSPTFTPTPSPTPSLPCNVNVGTWTGGSADWKPFNGVLLNDGTWNNDSGQIISPTIVAPCQFDAANYAVEAKIQVVSGSGCFGITTRGSFVSGVWQGYDAGVGVYYCGAYLGGSGTSVANISFTPGTTIHTYRVEANGNTIKFIIDGSPLLTIMDNRYLTGSQVGLFDSGMQLQVLSFQVTAI